MYENKQRRSDTFKWEANYKNTSLNKARDHGVLLEKAAVQSKCQDIIFK